MRTGVVRLTSIARVGLKAILRNPMRSSLTMLGIVIGVACVIAMVAVASGAAQSVQDNIGALGTNFIMVFPGAITQSGAHVHGGESTLTEEDAAAIKTECPSVAYVSAGTRTAAQVVASGMNWGTTIYGVDVEWPFIRAWNVADGEFFTDAEIRGAAKVCVLGQTTAENLFPDGHAVGQVVRIKNVPFRVLGVLEKKGGSTMGSDQDDMIAAPYTTVMKRLQGTTRLNIVYVAAVAPDRVATAQAEIEALIRQRHRIPPGEPTDVMMRSQEEISQRAAQATSTMSTLLGSVAAISLLVGGIGIMNIMLVSVTERTREIGIRRAVGAKGRHILLQFLLEAVTLSVVGGAAGIGLGVVVSRIIARFAEWAVVIAPHSIAIAFGFAALVGIFFGFYPARKASRLDPIEALRYE
jgi:putative ABC transport system permease protein